MARTHCRIDTNVEDTLLREMITAATEYVETRTKMVTVKRTFETRLNRFPSYGRMIDLPAWPLISVESVKYVNPDGVLTTMTVDVDYRVRADIHPGKLECITDTRVWPDTQDIGYVLVEYTAGYATVPLVPARAKQAVRMLVGHWYENRESVVIGGGAPLEVPQAVEMLCGSMWSGRVV
jgi:uncharacterized phiE125 gp8 family phage protein